MILKVCGGAERYEDSKRRGGVVWDDLHARRKEDLTRYRLETMYILG